MATFTPNINLTLPIGTEHVSRSVFNQNMTKIDTAIGNPSSASSVTGADAFSKINTLSSEIGRTALSSATDFDTLIGSDSTGYYKNNYYCGNDLSLHSNIPSGTWSNTPFSLDVIRLGTGYILQVLYIYRGGAEKNPRTFIRQTYFVSAGNTPFGSWDEYAKNSKIPVLLNNSPDGITGLNVDFSKYGAFIIKVPDNMTVTVAMVGVANAEFYGTTSIYGSASSPIVVKNYCFKVNSSATGFYIDTSKSYQVNFSTSGVSGVYQISNNKFTKVWGIPN